jgi:hypothetical protein
MMIVIVIILAYLAVSLLSNTGMSSRRWTGLLCFIMLWLCLHFVLGGATFDKLPRNIVLVTSCQNHQTLINDAVSNLELNGTPIKVLKFTFLEAELNSNCNNVSSHSDITEFSQRVTTGTINNPPPLAQLLEQASKVAAFDIFRPFASIRDLFSRTTVIFLYTQNSLVWDQKLELSGTGVADLLQVENVEHMDVFIFNKDQMKPSGHITLNLLGNVDPGRPYKISNQLVRLSLTGIGTSPTTPLKIKLCLSIDQPADLESCEKNASDGQLYFDQINLIPDQETKNHAWTWSFNNSSVAKVSISDLVFLASNSNAEKFGDKIFSQGWHSLSAVAKLISGPSTDFELPMEVSHFPVKSSGITVILGNNNLFNLNWPIPPSPESQEKILKNTWPEANKPRSQHKGRFDGLTPLSLILPASTSINEIKSHMEHSKTLILLEPELQLLQKINDEGLHNEITASGGSILIVGPPTLTASTTNLEQWLPAWATQSNGQVQTVETTRQIALIGDCGLLAHQPFLDNSADYLNITARRPIDLQNEIHSLLINKFNLPELSKFSYSKGLGSKELLYWYEQKNTWGPATKMSGTLGCIRPNLSNAPEVSALTGLSDPMWRMHAFTSDKSLYPGAPYGIFKPNNFYPGSTAIIFSTPIYVPDNGPSLKVKSISGLGRQGTIINSPEAVNLFKNMTDQGIQVILVELPANNNFIDANANTGWKNAVAFWQTQGIKYLPALGYDDGTDYATAIYQLLQQKNNTTDVSLTIQQHGRGIDPRLIEINSLTPPAWLTLHTSPNSDTLISTTNGNHALLVDRRVNNGRVAVLAFNPLAPQLWMSDILDPIQITSIFSSLYIASPEAKRWLGSSYNLSRLSGRGNVSQGIGIQRLIDAVGQMAVNTPADNALTLEKITVSSSGTDIDFTFQIPTGMDTWPTPSIEFNNPKEHCTSVFKSHACELSLIGLDQQTGRVIYRFNTYSKKGIKPDTGSQTLYLGNTHNRPLIEPVWFWLKKKERLNSLPKERLIGLIRSIGGEVITDFASFTKQASTSAIELTAIIFLLLTLLLFSPLVRPWTAFMRWRRRFDLLGTEQTLGFNPDTVSRRLSELLARYEAKRRAGDPAWLRRYQSGDSLSRAISSDLAAFLPVGKKLNLPKVPPRVRLREIGEGFDFLIFIDDSPSILHPGNLKRDSKKLIATLSLIDIIARSVSRLGGRWSLHSLRGQGSVGPLKMQSKIVVAQTIEQWLSKKKLPLEMQALPVQANQAIVLVISDFMTDSIDHYLKILGSRQSRVVMLRDPEQKFEAGFSYDAVSGRFYDRSEWESKDVEKLINIHRLEVRTAIELSGHKFADISVDGSDLEIAEALIRADLFDTTGTMS